jgi:hypothetical protein
MLEAAVARILEQVPEDALVLDLGGGMAPFNRADWVLDLLSFEERGTEGHHGPVWERFTARTWVQRDACARERWPWPDQHFDFAVCVATLDELRDPVWACHELSRVARGGYVEFATIEGSLLEGEQGSWLGRDEQRWLCELVGGELAFTAKAPSFHADPRLKVPGRWKERMAPEDHARGLFWEGHLPARERFLIGPERKAARNELRDRLRDRFEASVTEVRARQARDVAQLGIDLAKGPGRQAAGRVFDEILKRRPR